MIVANIKICKLVIIKVLVTYIQCDFQFRCKARLHELMQMDRDFTQVDRDKINPCDSASIIEAMDFVKNPYKCCKHVHELIKSLMEIVQVKKEDGKTKGSLNVVFSSDARHHKGYFRISLHLFHSIPNCTKKYYIVE